MKKLFLDFETFFSVQCSLRKLSTTQYIRHPDFLVWGVGMQWEDEEHATWITGHDCEHVLDDVDWENTALVCHNTLFDAQVLRLVYGHVAAFHYDTAAMSKGIWPTESASLANTVVRCFPGDPTMRKGEELVQAKGIVELPPDIEDAIAGYCKQDVLLTKAIFDKMAPHYPDDELQLIDMTCRMAIDPVLRIDRDKLQQYYDETVAANIQAIENSGVSREVLASNDKFAQHIESLNIVVPTKTSPTTGDPIPAFGKNDKGWQQLRAMYPEHEALWNARIVAKSRIDETRAQSFLDAADPETDLLPVPLRYYGAHTGRFSGTDGLNLQNLPRNSELRKCLIAPDNQSFVYVADLSNIESRMLAWLAGEEDMIHSYVQGADLYCDFASQIYNREITKADATERFVGKTCFTGDTQILTNNGVKRLDCIKTSDMVWDGTEWVTHQGLQYQGMSNVMDLLGVFCTPDHKIFTGNHWQEARALIKDANTLSQALDYARANLPSQVMSQGSEADAKHFLLNATAKIWSLLSTRITSKISNQRDVTHVPKNKVAKSVTGNTLPQCPTTSTEQGYLTAFHQQSAGAINQLARVTTTMVDAASWCMKHGVKTVQYFYPTFRLFPAGMTQASTWTGLTTTKDMSPATSDSVQFQKTCLTEDKLLNCKNKSNSLKDVYDIVNAGPRHRFTIITDHGPLIVHNCILGLGYGVGHRKLKETLSSGASGPVVELDESHARGIVQLYRNRFWRIPALWKRLEDMVAAMAAPTHQPIDYGPLSFGYNAIQLPSKLSLRYPELHFRDASLAYKTAKGVEYTYGGRLTENVVQALSRIIITNAMLAIEKEIPDSRVALTVHDEVVVVAPSISADNTLEQIIEILCRVPDWADGLPLAAEGGYANNYSK